MDDEPAMAAVADSCFASGQTAAETVPPGQVVRESKQQCPLVQFSAYKATRLSDIVCRRNVRLFSDRVQTLHPQSGDLSGNEKTWFLDRTCKLEPDYVQELIAETKSVRPPGQWTVTAKLSTVVGQTPEPVNLVSSRRSYKRNLL
jgi:hypothetical protein